MTDTLRPPPYRPRSKEGEPEREAPLTEEQLHTRDSVIVGIGIVAGIGVYAGLVLLLRELPGPRCC
jgi:hypothetical protein